MGSQVVQSKSLNHSMMAEGFKEDIISHRVINGFDLTEANQFGSSNLIQEQAAYSPGHSLC
jgi:hypothetical protein